MSALLSIIIPVFNGELYIAQCLQSLVSQLHDNVEIVVVNDGSSDATDQIIRSQFQNHIAAGQIIYLPTPNAGVSAARNLGLDTASGQYVAFVDADDVACPMYINKILTTLEDTPDIIEFGYKNIDLNGQTIMERGYIHTKFGNHQAADVINSVFGGCLWYPFLRVFRFSLFDGIRFPVGVRYCEDLMTLSAVYKGAVTIHSLSDILYDYRINPAGATQNPKPDYALKLIDFYRTLANDGSFANKALKINVAFAIRGCIANTTDPLGRMPSDIETDIRRLIWTPTLFLYIRKQFVVYAIWGHFIFFIKKILK